MNTRPSNSSPQTSIPRRDFLKGALVVGASSLVFPRVLLSQPGQASPNERINLACCGIGNRGKDVTIALAATGLANIVALCDTDMGAKQTQKVLEMFPDVPRFQDFRQMFDKMGNSIDAVSVATPDHSHFPIAMQAMALGKHVYCEKPMAHSYLQIALMMDAEKKYKVAAQMGNQGHSEANYFQFREWVNASVIKNVTKITAFMNNPRRWHGMKVDGFLPMEPVPQQLDWECWLATAAQHDFNQRYMNGEWRSWYAFGNGALGDWGAHIFDTAHEFLKLGLPTEVDPTLIEGYSPYIFPQASTLVFRFPQRGELPPVDLTWYDGQKNLAPLPEDFGQAVVDKDIPPPTSGTIDTKKTPPGKVIYGEGLTFKGGSHSTTLEIIGADKAADMASRLPEVPKSPSNHFANFLRSCKGEETCRSSFAVAGPLCQTMALGVIAQHVNGKVAFDPATQQITNSQEANAMLTGAPPRKDWEQYYKI